MNLLMTADTVGGVWTYAVDLCRGLADRGVTITLMTMGAPMSADQHAAVAGVAGLEVVETSYRLEWMSDAEGDLGAAGERLLALAERTRPDVVHLNGYAHAALPWAEAAGRRPGVVVVGHSCVETWWRAVKGEPTDGSWAAYRRLVRTGIHAADAFVAPTRAMLEAFGACHRPHARGSVIHNGRCGELYRPLVKEPTILAAGRLWDEAKNIAALDAAAARTRWPVAIAGSDQTPDGRRVEPRHARRLGPLPPAGLAEAMGRAAIYALPARYEPFGLSVLEAALCGCALVLGDIPTLREVWGDAARYVPPDDADALAATLDELAADDAARSRLAAQAQRRAARYPTARMADAYLALYRDLAGTGAAGPSPSLKGAA